jgi:hypothetical protein
MLDGQPLARSFILIAVSSIAVLIFSNLCKEKVGQVDAAFRCDNLSFSLEFSGIPLKLHSNVLLE